MSASPFSHVADISRWLADAGIERLELDGPLGRLVLSRAGASVEPGPKVPAQDVPETGTIVRSPGMGILRLTHPLHDGALAPVGTKVRDGQALAVLQTGAILTPVEAPCDGIVVAVHGADGRVTGYGDALFALSPTREGPAA